MLVTLKGQRVNSLRRVFHGLFLVDLFVYRGM